MGITDEGKAAAVEDLRSDESKRMGALLEGLPDGKAIGDWLSSFEEARGLLNTVEEEADMQRMMTCICESADCNCRVVDAEFAAITAFVKERSDALEKKRAEYLASKGLKLEEFP